MDQAKPLPGYLAQRYHGWKATGYADNEAWYRHLASEGQHPRAMVICCCDSRVNATTLFGADQGEFFIHRNIANLVPPYQPDGDHHGTSAAVEYAVNMLRVTHLIVMGHSGCGGVQGCIDMCRGQAPELEEKESFIGRWMDILKPRYERVAEENDPVKQAQQLEKHAVLVSLENLASFPFIATRLAEGTLTLHGLWTDIGAGGLEYFNPAKQAFQPV
ncbi:carbonic anhydrase [uncultured Roseobacter sp.]|uniref:carbonic anhydrase n=1 Tax=uncultured Roseobacter sp. TaxID=114847 RepID=UPI002638B30B|nr:carbonic anhydrase [uncultured Roseobacter sp.]